MADFPLYSFTTQEDWYGELQFFDTDGNALSLAGRAFVMLITPAAAGGALVDPVRELTMQTGGGLSFKAGADNTIVFRVPRTTARTFPRGEFSADVLEVVSGERYLFMPVRVRYAEPAALLSYVSRLVGVAVNFAARQQPIVTPVAITGRQGAPGATIITGTASPVPADGKDGDFYIEDRTGASLGRRMYGPKAGGAWPGTPWNIQVTAISDVPGLTSAIQASAQRSANLGDLSSKTAARANLDLAAAFQPLTLSPTPPSVDLIATAPNSIPASWFSRGLAALATDALGLPRSAAANDPRIDHNPTTGLPLGLVIEEPRTYSIRKNDMAGAVAGSPGTLPAPAGAGRTNATINVLASGFIGDAPYIDLEFVFSAGGSVTLRWNGTVTTVVPAAETSTWAYVIDAALLPGSGPMSDLSVAEMSVSARNGSGAAVAGGYTATSLSGVTADLKPYSVVGSMVAGTVYVAEGISLTARVATTIRMRFVLPQMEQGLFPTRRVITRATVLTRPADSLVIPLSAALVSAIGNTLRVAAWMPTVVSSGFATLCCLDNGTASERIVVQVSPAGAVSSVMVAGGATVATLALGSVSLGAEARVALDYQAGSFRGSLNGNAVVSAAPASLPSLPVALRGGVDAGQVRYLNAPLSRLSLIPRPQAAATILSGMAA